MTITLKGKGLFSAYVNDSYIISYENKITYAKTNHRVQLKQAVSFYDIINPVVKIAGSTEEYFFKNKKKL